MGPRQCRGSDGTVCIFHSAQRGQPALAKQDGQCSLCNAAQMIKLCSTARMRGTLRYQLQNIYELDKDIYLSALDRVPLAWRATIDESVKAAALQAKQKSETVGQSERSPDDRSANSDGAAPA